ncbi:hypothetical protein THAOC_26008 [Thalassiosira oceanica]|uniref:Uncharacterized protein n=1 Tax=Thalassiosira oceanica TaxID=159749 RepID=K0S671_THAOC|nr:hypothetical protein THAOC_26008 [Thalassiosira oceanica]|eukprot:EJK54372.1 hypothetical protein THAOC_26008 [Thalassiosira oceanica]
MTSGVMGDVRIEPESALDARPDWWARWSVGGGVHADERWRSGSVSRWAAVAAQNFLAYKSVVYHRVTNYDLLSLDLGEKSMPWQILNDLPSVLSYDSSTIPHASAVDGQDSEARQAELEARDGSSVDAARPQRQGELS